MYKGEIDGAAFTNFGGIESLVSPSNYGIDIGVTITEQNAHQRTTSSSVMNYPLKMGLPCSPLLKAIFAPASYMHK